MLSWSPVFVNAILVFFGTAVNVQIAMHPVLSVMARLLVTVHHASQIQALKMDPVVAIQAFIGAQ